MKIFFRKSLILNVTLMVLSFFSGALLVSFSQNKTSLHIESYPTKHYEGFSLQYDPKNKIPLWTYEMMDSQSLSKNVSRSTVRFQKDSSIYPMHQSSLQDYSQSGFDRGHMVPAADQQSSKANLEKTFLLTNICPQNAGLNRGLWAKLESTVRQKVSNEQNVEVITGPLFMPINEGNSSYVKYQVIGKNQVGVPTHFFKVLYCNSNATAYIIPNQNINPQASLEEFQVSVEEVERSSGLKFHFN